MQGILNNYILELNVNGYELSRQEIRKITLTTQLNNIPKFEMILAISNKSLLFEGVTCNSTLVLQIRKNQNETSSRYILQVSRIRISPDIESVGNYVYIISGIPVSYNKYINGTRIFAYGAVSSVSAIQSAFVAAGIECISTAASSDVMEYIQYGNTYQNFVNETMLHSNISDSLLVLAMSFNNTHLLDISTIYKSNPSIEFNSIEKQPLNKQRSTSLPIIFYNSCRIYDNSALSASVDTNNKTMIETDISTGTKNTYKSDTYKKAARDVYIAPDFSKQYASQLLSNNTHKAYNSGYLSNLSTTNSMNAIDIEIPTDGNLPRSVQNIRIGMKCRYLLINPEANESKKIKNVGEVDTVYTGDYIISKRSQIFKLDNYSEEYGLSKEGLRHL